MSSISLSLFHVVQVSEVGIEEEGCHQRESPGRHQLPPFGFILGLKAPLCFAVGIRQLFSLRITDEQLQNVYISENLRNNIYLQGFLKNLFLRNSCANCSAKSLRSKSDITLGDFWGINHYYPDFNDDKGVSAVLANTQQGNDLLKKVKPDFIPVQYQEVLQGNSSLEVSAVPHPKRNQFFKDFIRHKKSVSILVNNYLKPNITQRIKNKLYSILFKRK